MIFPDHWISLLTTFRKIQYMTSSFNTTVLLNHHLFLLQMTLFFTGLFTTIMGRFYYQERFHMYGCRSNYQHGFPYRCPSDKRPNDIDIATGTCYAMSFVCLCLMMIIPTLWARFHWKCDLTREIWFYCMRGLKKKKAKMDKCDFLSNILVRLEGVHSLCGKRDCGMIRKDTKTHQRRLFVHLGSCMWSELFLLYHFKRWKIFVPMFIMVIVCITCPLFVPLVAGGWSRIIMMVSMLTFSLCPIFSATLLVLLIVCVLSVDGAWMTVIITVTAWLVTWIVTLLLCYVREKDDEEDLVRKAYGAKLPMFMKTVQEGDIDLLLYLRGYKHDRKTSDICEFLKRLKQ